MLYRSYSRLGTADLFLALKYEEMKKFWVKPFLK